MLHARRKPAAVESTVPPVIPDPVAIGPTGRIGWPGVVVYVTAINGATVRSPVPPPAGIAYRCVPARPGVLAQFDALSRSGALRDPRHTGRDGVVVDQRKAPQQ